MATIPQNTAVVCPLPSQSGWEARMQRSLKIAQNEFSKASADVTAVERNNVTVVKSNGVAVVRENDMSVVERNGMCSPCDIDCNSRNSEGYSPLTRAAEMGKVEQVEMLLRCGANVNISTYPWGYSALDLAVLNDDTEMTKVLLESGADPNTQPEWGQPAILTGTETGNIDIVKLLLAHGANVDVQRPFTGETALMVAVKGGRQDIVELLLTHGCDADVLDHSDRTCLMQAVEAGNNTMCRTLLQFGVDCNVYSQCILVNDILQAEKANMSLTRTETDSRGLLSLFLFLLSFCLSFFQGPSSNTAKSNNCHYPSTLKSAAKKSNTNIVTYVLDPVSVANTRHNKTALMLASELGRTETVKILLEFGADINVQIPLIGDSALLLAVKRGKRKIVELLLQASADVTVRDLSGNTVAHWVEQQRDVDLAEIFLRNGCPLKSRSMAPSFSRNWEFACLGGNWANESRIAKRLLAAGADVNERDESGSTLLMKACFENDFELVKECLYRGADPTRQDDNGRDSLLRAVRTPQGMGNPAVVELLLKHGAVVNKYDKDGRTPVHWAAYLKRLDTLQVFISAEPKIDLPGKEDGSVLAECLRGTFSRQTDQCATFLLSHGFKAAHKGNKFLLYRYILKGNLEMVQTALRAGAPVDTLKMDFTDFGSLIYKSGPFDVKYFQPLFKLEDRNVGFSKLNIMSPIYFALCMDKADIARYLAQSWVLTQADLKYFCVNAKLFRINDYLEVTQDCPRVYKECFSQPPSLEMLSFVNVSVSLGWGPDRRNRVHNSGLPQIYQNKLLFL